MSAATHDVATTMDRPKEIDELETLLQGRLHGRIFDLHIRLRDDGLVLEGRAHSYYGKQIAQQAVMEACERPIVANAIEVV